METMNKNGEPELDKVSYGSAPPTTLATKEQYGENNKHKIVSHTQTFSRPVQD